MLFMAVAWAACGIRVTFKGTVFSTAIAFTQQADWDPNSVLALSTTLSGLGQTAGRTACLFIIHTSYRTWRLISQGTRFFFALVPHHRRDFGRRERPTGGPWGPEGFSITTHMHHQCPSQAQDSVLEGHRRIKGP